MRLTWADIAWSAGWCVDHLLWPAVIVAAVVAAIR